MTTMQTGLTSQEVQARIAAGQVNHAPSATSRSLGDIIKASVNNAAAFLICKGGGTGAGGPGTAELPACQCVESAPNGIVGYESGATCRVTAATAKCQGSADTGGSDEGLSLGAKIGIGVGAVTVLGGLAYFLTRNKA